MKEFLDIIQYLLGRIAQKDQIINQQSEHINALQERLKDLPPTVPPPPQPPTTTPGNEGQD